MILVHDEESDDDPDLNDGVDYNEYEVGSSVRSARPTCRALQQARWQFFKIEVCGAWVVEGCIATYVCIA
jgi:hypothetical protein